MVNRRVVLYSVPLVSIIMLGFVLFINEPKLTGMVVFQEVADFNVSISTANGELLPEKTTVVVKIDDYRAEMPLKDFINKSGGVFEREKGNSTVVEYSGWGYIGNYNYMLSIQEFNLTPALDLGEHLVVITLKYKEKIISKTNETFSVI